MVLSLTNAAFPVDIGPVEAVGASCSVFNFIFEPVVEAVCLVVGVDVNSSFRVIFDRSVCVGFVVEVVNSDICPMSDTFSVVADVDNAVFDSVLHDSVVASGGVDSHGCVIRLVGQSVFADV